MLVLFPDFYKVPTSLDQIDYDREKDYIELYQRNINSAEKIEFIFFLDRSGSMQSGNRISKAKEALNMFIKSLPLNCKFNVVSFGSDYSLLFKTGSQAYVEENVELALSEIKKFDADMSGTNILSPLKYILKDDKTKDTVYTRVLFLLTDGAVDNEENVIKIIKESEVQVHTFGIGYDASKDLIKKAAAAGNGTYHFISDKQRVTGRVIDALKKSTGECLINGKIRWKEQPEDAILYEHPAKKKVQSLFKNEVLQAFFILDSNKIEKGERVIDLSFKKRSDKSKVKYQLPYSIEPASNSIEGNEIFKLCANSICKKTNSDEISHDLIREIATKFGVLSSQTAFIAIKKNKDQSTAVSIQSKEIPIFIEKYNDPTNLLGTLTFASNLIKKSWDGGISNYRGRGGSSFRGTSFRGSSFRGESIAFHGFGGGTMDRDRDSGRGGGGSKGGSSRKRSRSRSLSRDRKKKEEEISRI